MIEFGATLHAAKFLGEPAKHIAVRPEKTHHGRVKEIWQNESVIAHTQLLARSLKHWTGRDLMPGNWSPAELAEKIFHAPFALVAHGTEPEPVLNYGNRTALWLWEMPWEEFTRTPSRLTAEAVNRAERARLLATVTERGFMEDYAGIRIAKTGRRFRILQATVWNLLTDAGVPAGQAAMFTRWEML